MPREEFCQWLNNAIAAGVQFAFPIIGDINGSPYVRYWPIVSLKDTGEQYEIHLNGYGVASVPYGTKFQVAAS